MNSMSGKELAKLLERNGWTLLRIQGSHHIYGKSGNPSRISVPIHKNKDIKVGLLRNLLKTAGLLEIASFEDVKEITEEATEEQRNSDDINS